MVHHINGDKADNRLENLITVGRAVSTAIHHGARHIHPDDLEHQRRERASYVEESAKRIRILKQYVDWLQDNGYPRACLESLPLSFIKSATWRKGANEHLHISARGKGYYSNHYWVVLLEPTGESFRLESFNESYERRHGYPYGQKPDFEMPGFEEKCDGCSYDGEPPCDDFHPGPYCFGSTEVKVAVCSNCLFEGTEECPLLGLDMTQAESISSCAKYVEREVDRDRPPNLPKD